MLFKEKPNPATLTDEEVLVLSLKTPSAFAVIMQRYEAAFLRKAKSILGDREEVLDVVAESFTKIYFHATKFERQEGASFRSWAYRILINTALTHYQKLKRKRERELVGSNLAWELIPSREQTEEDASWRDIVVRTLAKMPQTLARTLHLFFLEDKSQSEVAAAEGISLAAVKTRIHRAKREFKKLYESAVFTV